MNDDGQLRAVHLILDFEPISRSFLDVGNSIRANDYRLARIDVSRLGFLAPHDLPPVDHPILQGIPFAAQPLQQVPLEQAIVGEGAASSSSLEEEIDRFQFEEEAIVISEAEEGVDEYSCVQTPAQIITYIGDSSNEEEAMAPKTGPSLRELMKNRNKAPSLKDKNKSKPLVNPPPPPPQIPTNLGLKPNPDLRKKGILKLLKRESWALSKEVNSLGNHRTTGIEGPTLWIAERSLRWPKYAGPPVLDRSCWRWMVCQSRMMPPSGIIAGGTLAWWPRL